MTSLPALLQFVPHRILASELSRRSAARIDKNLRSQYRQISKAVALHFQVDVKMMRSQSRRAEYTWPRYLVMHVLRQLGWGLEAIRDVFGYSCHQTIMHGLRSHQIRSRTDASYHQYASTLLVQFKPICK